MWTRGIVGVAVAGLVALGMASCGDDDAGDSCAGVTCGGHGKCHVGDQGAYCECEPDYKPQGLTCVEESAGKCGNQVCDPGEFPGVGPDACPDDCPPSGVKVVDLCAGERHACALVQPVTGRGASVFCWGSNDSGQLGVPPGAEPGGVVKVESLPPGLEDVACGRAHTCVLTAGDQVLCWGANDNGQSSDAGGTRVGPGEAQVAVEGAFALSAGGDTTCVALEQGPSMRWVTCWGDNTSRQINCDDQAVYRPRDGVGAYFLHTDGSVVDNILSVRVGGSFVCVLDGNVEVPVCRGWSFSDCGSTPPLESSTIGGMPPSQYEMSSGFEHACASAQGILFCWGDNAAGQLGGESNGIPAEAVRVALPTGLLDYLGVAAGSDHSCGVVGGKVFCWGDNSRGQLGRDDVEGGSTPVAVSVCADPTGVVAAGEGFTCAACHFAADQAGFDYIYCWGANQVGQLGNPAVLESSSAQPVPVVIW